MVNRRQFLAASGFAAISISELFADSTAQNVTQSHCRPDPLKQKNNALKAIAFGVYAPNPHNTQAWKFKLLSENSFLFFIDEKKILPFTDPLARQVHIGCGAFLESMRVGSTLVGLNIQWKLFPKGVVGPGRFDRPVARVEIFKSHEKPHFLANGIQRRSTSRLHYTSPMTNEDFKMIKKFLPEIKTELRLMTKEVPELRKIVKKAFELEVRTERTSEESRLWFRGTQKSIEKERDGINLPATGIDGFKRWFLETFIDLKSRANWHTEKSYSTAIENISGAVDSTDSFLAMLTVENTPMDWIQTGCDYLLLQVASIQKGFYFHPLSQALQEYAEVRSEQTKLNDLLGVQANQKIQMLLRVGKSEIPWQSYRKEVENLVLR